MGSDSIQPFLNFKNKWTIIVLLTSNSGYHDFQFPSDQKENPLFEKILKKSLQWAEADKIMYVIGANHAHYLKKIRTIIPNHFLLIPGIGAQKGNLSEVMSHGFNKQGGLLISASRSIIYAEKSKNFALASQKKAQEIQKKLAKYLYL